jgi:carbon storage regulator
MDRRLKEESMLVLTRRPGEQVVIAGTIRVTLLEAAGNRVRIGITAPPAVSVRRAELQERRRSRRRALHQSG